MNSYDIIFYTSDNGPISISVGIDDGIDKLMQVLDNDIFSVRSDAPIFRFANFRYRVNLISGFAVVPKLNESQV